MLPVSMWLQLDRTSRASLVAQLVEQLRARAMSGQFVPGTRLPSSRALAAELGIARSVVVRAYEQLDGEGYLESVAGSGTRIAQGLVPPAPGRGSVALHDTNEPSATPRVHAPAPSPAHKLIDLRAGYPFVPHEPPLEWRRALTAAARQPLAGYAPHALGEPRLREQIALHVTRSRGIQCTADDVVVTAGTVDSLLLLALALGGGAWGTEDPGYPEARNILRLGGADVTPLAVGPEGLRVSQLPETPFDAMLVTPSHQFPLGGRMPASERTALVAWAAERGSLIVEDDYDSEFRHAGPALPAIAALDPGGIVAHIGSLNKTLSPSLRCGYVITTAESPVWQALTATKRVMGSSVPSAVQAATSTLFETGGFRRYLARTRREYRHRRSVLLDTLATHGLGDRVSGDEGGLHAVLTLPDRVSAASLVTALRERGIRVESVREFSELPYADDSIVIGYGAASISQLETGITEIARTLREQRTMPARHPQRKFPELHTTGNVPSDASPSS